jgi:hypothetical protein
MKKIGFFIVVWSLLSVAYAQQTGIIENKIIFKVKEDYNWACHQKGILLPEVNAILHSSVVSQITQIFPQATSSFRKNEKEVNISLLYEVTLTHEKWRNKIIAQLQKRPELEYAEEKNYYLPLSYVPNDPFANLGNGNQAVWLSLIKAYQAWATSKGDTNVIIGIIDTGTDFNHPDLSGNVARNWADPINGLDDDNDGFIDNFRGWDLSDNDNDARPSTTAPAGFPAGHGTVVAGLAAASTDNGVGVAATGFRCRYMPIKVYGNNGGNFRGYEGIVYAADRGCKVINLSWGGKTRPSQFEQDLINYAVFNKNVAVVAAAGNTNEEADYYPASYQNVLSVAYTNLQDVRFINSTYSVNVDLVAPGEGLQGIIGTSYGNLGNGSSLSAPIVAGALALVRSHYPQLTAVQAMEIIRVNADNIYNTGNNSSFLERLGTGRLNMEKAILRFNNVSVRATQTRALGKTGMQLRANDTVSLSFNFQNHLAQVNNLTVSISSTSPHIQMMQNSWSAGTRASNTAFNNHNQPFQFRILPTAPVNDSITIRLQFTGSNGYSDFQFVTLYINNNYLSMSKNQLTLTLNGRGRLAYHDNARQRGLGLIFNNQNLLFEGGLMLATNNARTPNTVRNNNTQVPVPERRDNDFLNVIPIRFTGNTQFLEEATTTFTDAAAPSANQIGVSVRQRAYNFNTFPLDKVIFLEYEITNTTNSLIADLYAGLFADFDIPPLASNRVQWDAATRMGYTFNTTTGSNTLIGVQALSPQNAAFYAIDNSSSTAGGNINMLDGFSRAEKFQTLSNGVARQQAGMSTAQGNDVMQVTGLHITNLAAGQKQKVAFAIVAGNTVTELRNNAIAARNRFRLLNQSAAPTVTPNVITVCKGTPITITPNNGTRFRFYSNAGLTQLLAQGSSFTFAAQDTAIIYVTGADSLFESAAQTVQINAQRPVTQFAINPNPAVVNTPVTFTDQSSNAVSWSWNLGNGQSSVQQQTVQTYAFVGNYPITLITTDANGCRDTLTRNLLVQLPSSIPSEIAPHNLSVYPTITQNTITIDWKTPLQHNYTLQLTDMSGKILKQMRLMPHLQTIQLSDVAQGMYLLHIYSADLQRLRTEKIIKE